jgi:hypothetical protein
MTPAASGRANIQLSPSLMEGSGKRREERAMSEMQDNSGRPPAGDPAAGSQGNTVPASQNPAGSGQPASGQPTSAQPTSSQPTGAQPATGSGQPEASAAEEARAARERGGTSQATMEADTTAGETGQRDTGRHYVPRPAPGYDDARPYEARHADAVAGPPPSGAALGLTIMAAVLMMVAGLLNFFAGLAVIIRGSFLVVLPNYAFSLSPLGWGWLNVIVGAVVFVAGAALFAGHLWARIVGVVIAALSIVANFVALPYYPVWAILVIALDAFVIWALLTPRNRYFT